MNTLDLLKCGTAIGIEVAALYAVAKLAARFTQSPHWQRTIWQAAFVAMLIAFAGEVNGVRGLFAPAPLPLPKPVPAVASSVVTVAPVEFDSFTPLPVTEPMFEVQELPATLATPEQQISTPDVLRWCWITGAAVLLLRMFVALLFTIVFRMAAERVANTELLECLDRLRALLRIRRHVGLRQTGRVGAPFTFGVVRPVIVLPRRFSTAFNSEQQQLALLHELAHIAAFDAVWRVVANILCVLLWWHPLVWMARRELAHASEAAADEASLAIENGPAHLADCLLQCARQLKPSQRHLWIGMGGFRSSIGKRIERLMELTRPSQPIGRPASWTVRAIVPAVTTMAFWATISIVTPEPAAWRESIVGTFWSSAARAADNATTLTAQSVEGATVNATQEPVAVDHARTDTHRDLLREKLRTVLLPDFEVESLPLREVVKDLNADVRKADPDRLGVNFLIAIGAPSEERGIDPPVTVPPGLNLSVEEALNRIASGSAPAIRWHLEDFGVVFSRIQAPANPVPQRKGQTAGNAVTRNTVAKLRSIRFSTLLYDGLPLSEVVKTISEEVKRQDPEPNGIVFEILENAAAQNSIRGIGIRITPALRNITVEEALDAVTLVAEGKIAWRVDGDRVVIYPRSGDQAQLHTRFFKVNTVVLLEALQTRFGTNDPLEIPKNAPRIDAPSAQPSIEKPNTGISLLTRATATTMIPLIKKHFSSMGVNLDEHGKGVFLNNRGYLMVRTTLEELDQIEAALKVIDPGSGPAAAVRADIAAAPIKMSPQREKIYEKLRTIRLPELRFDSLPLAEVIKSLSEAVRKQDTENSGINIMISAPAETSNSINSVTIRVSEPLRNITVEEALNVIAMAAERKIKWRVEDFGVVLSQRAAEAIPLHDRFFKVDVALIREDLQKRFGNGPGSSNEVLQIPNNTPLLDRPPATEPPLEKRNAGMSYIAEVQPAATVIPQIKRYFASIGVNLDEPGKAAFFNDRLGYLMVRATLEELEAIEEALKVIDPASQSAGRDQQRVQLQMQVKSPNAKNGNAATEETRLEYAKLVQDGKLLFEQGRLEEARTNLLRAVELDTDAIAAKYYLTRINIRVAALTNSEAETDHVKQAYRTAAYRISANTLMRGLTDLYNFKTKEGVTYPSGSAWRVTAENLNEKLHEACASAGLELWRPGKYALFDHQTEEVRIRGTEKDIETVGRMVSLLKQQGPFVELRVRTFEVPTNEKRMKVPVARSGAPTGHLVVAALTEEQARATAHFEKTAHGHVFAPVVVASGTQAAFNPESQGKRGERVTSSDRNSSTHGVSAPLAVLPLVHTNGVIQIKALPTIAEFLGKDQPADTIWATGGPYAPPDRLPVLPGTGPRFRTRQIEVTGYVYDGQTLVIDRTAFNGSTNVSTVCYISARIVDEIGQPIRTSEELKSFKTVPQQPKEAESLPMQSQAATRRLGQQNRIASEHLGARGPALSEVPLLGRFFRNSEPGEASANKLMADTQPANISEREPNPSPSPTNTPSLHTRFFRLDPANLSSVVARDPKSGAVRKVLPAAAQTNDIRSLLHEFFKWAGADLDEPGKTFSLNEKNGYLMIRGTMSDIEAVQSGVTLINTSPPQLTIEVKAIEVPIRAIRDKSLRLPTLGKPAVVVKAGEMGSNQPAPTAASVITRSQFADVLRSLSDVPGADVLSMRAVTTMSGRQAQIKVVDVRHIVTDVDITTNSAPGKSRSWWPFGRARDKRDIRPISEPFELGPVIDVVPTVEADGYTIQMTVLPTLREFLGYDDPGIFQVESGGMVSPTPLPKFRIRQVATTARVWDGQTLVIGAGHAPAKDGTARELIFFITPRLIDPAGNPVHREDDLEDASVPAASASGTRVWADPIR